MTYLCFTVRVSPYLSVEQNVVCSWGGKPFWWYSLQCYTGRPSWWYNFWLAKI